MAQTNGILSAADIVKVAPRSIIMMVIRGVMKYYGFIISVMLDKNEDDTSDKKTGKVFIHDADPADQAPYCMLLRTSLDQAVSDRCGRCDRDHFEIAKARALSNPNYKGDVYLCSSGNLWDLVVPIVERGSNTFIGAVLGGQKRPKESPIMAWQRLRAFVSQDENQCLRSIPFLALFLNYLRVPQAAESDLREMASVCQEIASELAMPFELLVNIKKKAAVQRAEQDIVNKIDSLLIASDDIKIFGEFVNRILVEINRWLPIDWAMVLAHSQTRNDDEVFDTTGMIGRGIRLPSQNATRQFVMPGTALGNAKTPLENPEFLRRHVTSIVAGQPEWWWIPLVTSDDRIIGAIVLGSAPQHRNTSYNSSRISEVIDRLAEMARKMATKYSELSALESARQKTAELKRGEEQLQQTIHVLEDTLLSHTHQTRRPLVMLRAVLSNVRDLFDKAPLARMMEDVELGIIAAQQAELLNRGITRIFGIDMGGTFKYNPTRIDARAQLEELTKSMQRLSGRDDLSFSYFQESPMVTMDLHSFLYVFYVLIDNAIKYSYANTTIALVCDMEGFTYALKVKSYGLPIDDPASVFVKFKRGQNAWRFDESGIGLGCWSAREHMRRFGGDITVETSGNLSVFIVHLPPVKTVA